MLCTLSRTYLNRFCLVRDFAYLVKNIKNKNAQNAKARFIGNTYLFHITVCRYSIILLKCVIIAPIDTLLSITNKSLDVVDTPQSIVAHIYCSYMEQ